MEPLFLYLELETHQNLFWLFTGLVYPLQFSYEKPFAVLAQH